MMIYYYYMCFIIMIKYVSSRSRIPQSVNYKYFYQYINTTNVKLIYEIGSRDLKDGNNLANHFNNIVYSFEANPENYEEMETNNIDNRVKIIKSAVSEVDGHVMFYPYNLTIYNNRGAGSLLLADFVTNRNIGDADYNRKQVQFEKKVNSTRLDTFIKSYTKISPDLLAIDVQETELSVLRSLGQYINQVKYIILETTFYSQYKNGQTFADILSFLNSKNFTMKVLKYQGKGGVVFIPPLKPISGGGDVLFINSNYDK